jgi:hypothetical protein
MIPQKIKYYSLFGLLAFIGEVVVTSSELQIIEAEYRRLKQLKQ